MYPVGHPIIITRDFKDVENYFGIIKCKILPPRGLFLPVLPYRCQNKLMFPLCCACTEIMFQGECQHNDNKRSLIGTWVTEEVKVALKKGYKIMKRNFLLHFLNIYFWFIKIFRHNFYFFRFTRFTTLKKLRINYLHRT